MSDYRDYEQNGNLPLAFGYVNGKLYFGENHPDIVTKILNLNPDEYTHQSGVWDLQRVGEAWFAHGSDLDQSWGWVLAPLNQDDEPRVLFYSDTNDPFIDRTGIDFAAMAAIRGIYPHAQETRFSSVNPDLWALVYKVFTSFFARMRNQPELWNDDFYDEIYSNIVQAVYDAYPPNARPTNEQISEAASMAMDIAAPNREIGNDSPFKLQGPEDFIYPEIPEELAQKIPQWGEEWGADVGEDPRWPGLTRENHKLGIAAPEQITQLPNFEEWPVLDHDPDQLWFSCYCLKGPTPGKSKDFVSNVTWQEAQAWLLPEAHGKRSDMGQPAYRASASHELDEQIRNATPNQPFKGISPGEFDIYAIIDTMQNFYSVYKTSRTASLDWDSYEKIAEEYLQIGLTHGTDMGVIWNQIFSVMTSIYHLPDEVAKGLATYTIERLMGPLEQNEQNIGGEGNIYPAFEIPDFQQKFPYWQGQPMYGGWKEAEALTPIMPDLNHVLDYNPEDVEEEGWQAAILYPNWTYPIEGITGNPSCSSPGITWQEAKQFLLKEWGNNTHLVKAIEKAIPEEPFEFVWDTWDPNVENWIKRFPNQKDIFPAVAVIERVGQGRFAKVGANDPISAFAAANGWDFLGLTMDGHWKWSYTDPNSISHLIITGDPRKLKQNKHSLSNALGDFKRCMRGACQHYQQRQSDYFYDWNRFSPDDGSLEDDKPLTEAGPPAFIGLPNRCPSCGNSDPGHLVNLDEYDQSEPDRRCPDCGKPYKDNGYSYPMEYDQIVRTETPWHVLNAVHDDEQWPLIWESGPWRFEWNGGRLMNIYHRDNPGHAVDAIPATTYDWENGQPNYEEDPYAEMILRAQNWIQDHAAEIEREVLPYAYRDEESNIPYDYPEDIFPEDWLSKVAALTPQEQEVLSLIYRYPEMFHEVMEIYNNVMYGQGGNNVNWDFYVNSVREIFLQWFPALEHEQINWGAIFQELEGFAGDYYHKMDQTPSDLILPPGFSHQSAYEETIIDINGEEIIVGARVQIPPYPKQDKHYVTPPSDLGVVTKITDPDGDVDDYGRSITIPPRVYVQFDDGDETYFTTHWDGKYYDDPVSWMCEDLEVIEDQLRLPTGHKESAAWNDWEDWKDPFVKGIMERRKKRLEEEKAKEPRYDFMMPDKALQEALYRHMCPMCRGYLDQQGEFFKCRNCPYSYSPENKMGGRFEKKLETIPGQTILPNNIQQPAEYKPRHTWDSVNQMLGDQQSIKVDNNTFLERIDDDSIGLRLHKTYVVIYHPNHVEMNTGGWNTQTTRNRINSWIPRGWVHNYRRPIGQGDYENWVMYSPYYQEEDPHPQYHYLDVYNPDKSDYAVNSDPYAGLHSYFWHQTDSAKGGFGSNRMTYPPGHTPHPFLIDYEGKPINPKQSARFNPEGDENPQQYQTSLPTAPIWDEEKGTWDFHLNIGDPVYVANDPDPMKGIIISKGPKGYLVEWDQNWGDYNNQEWMPEGSLWPDTAWQEYFFKHPEENRIIEHHRKNSGEDDPYANDSTYYTDQNDPQERDMAWNDSPASIKESPDPKVKKFVLRGGNPLIAEPDNYSGVSHTDLIKDLLESDPGFNEDDANEGFVAMEPVRWMDHDLKSGDIFFYRHPSKDHLQLAKQLFPDAKHIRWPNYLEDDSIAEHYRY